MAGTRLSRVTGLADARKALRQLPVNVERKVLRAAVRSGAAVTKAAVKAAAPVGDEPSKISAKFGHLKDNIRVIRLKRDIPKGSAQYRVDTGKAPQGFWREFGTSKQPARPWFRPAVDSSFAKAVNKMKEQLAKGVAREAEKLGKGRKK